MSTGCGCLRVEGEICVCLNVIYICFYFRCIYFYIYLAVSYKQHPSICTSKFHKPLLYLYPHAPTNWLAGQVSTGSVFLL